MKKFLAACLFLGCSMVARAGETANEQPTDYYRFTPDFITNLASGADQQYIKVRVEVKVEKPASLEDMKYHDPLLRDRLLRLFNESDGKSFKDPEKVKALREQAKTAINELLAKETGNAQVATEVLFTELVTE